MPLWADFSRHACRLQATVIPRPDQLDKIACVVGPCKPNGIEPENVECAEVFRISQNHSSTFHFFLKKKGNHSSILIASECTLPWTTALQVAATRSDTQELAVPNQTAQVYPCLVKFVII
jgi:hypothetical protein